MALGKDQIKKAYSEKNLSLFKKIKNVLTSPTKFYNSVKSEKGFKSPMIYLLVMSLLSTVLSTVYTLVFPSSFLGVTVPTSLEASIIGILDAFVIGIIATFLIVGLFHVFVYLLGGKNGFLQTFKSNVYGSTPSYIFGWIPYVNIVAAVYTLFYLIPKGISMQHNMSMGRAVLAVVLPIIIILVLVFVLFAAFFVVLLSALSSGQFSAPPV